MTLPLPNRTAARRAGLAVLALLLPLSGCGTASDVSPLGDSTASSSAGTVAPEPAGSGTAEPQGSTAAPPPTGAPVPGFTPRSVDLRGLQLHVETAVVAAIRPDTFGDPAQTPEPADQPYLFLTGGVRNLLAFKTDFIAYDEVLLDLGDDHPVPADSASTLNEVVDGEATLDGFLAFPLPAGAAPAAVAAGALRLGGAGHETEALTLGGPPVPSRWPLALSLRSPGAVHPVDAPATTFVVRIDKAWLADSVAYDDGGRSVTTAQSLVGRRKLVVKFTVAYRGKGSAVFAYDLPRLVVDGEVVSGAPEISDSAVVEPPAKQHLTFVWDVPQTGSVGIRWGKGGPTTRIPVR